ncbi:PQQ-dependent sugar dehydrogenase [Seonamhaeicola maritimus]|uniref:Choice-of-anchor D domain-containing protein n=1 Tax=Seonamhaeicola maritimus TaxID=2591822 RepID=A0A5C7GEC3_9FLAO|nr:PQQ-dependent sugar dehydrogenase [Seonamhaeicola maritimus]TXG34494.1 choice-of-anchor D domain-containing protein [Seonamhaeicola maritimus]
MNLILPTKKLLIHKTLAVILFLFVAHVGAQGTLQVSGNGNVIASGDNTPSTSDNTDFGTIGQGGSINKTFIIDNTAGGGSPGRRLNNIVVTIDNSDFSPTPANLGNLKGNENPINHSITFTPSTTGIQTATVTVSFSNGTNNPYTFTIQGEAVVPIPEIEIRGNGIAIPASGNLTNSIADNTDFGTTNEGSTIDRDFTIHNLGTGTLNISSIVLGNPTDFALVNSGSSSIAPGGSTTMTIRYNALTSATHYSSITVSNSDSDENPYLINIEATATEAQYIPLTTGPDWTVTNITADNELDYPNEITFGPDDFLWITERVGKKVVKVSPDGGSKIVMLDLTAKVHQSAGQDGLMGMAIHPDLYVDLNTTNNFVYLAYTYDSGGRKLRIERYTYNSTTGLLNSGSNTTIIEGFDASNDHNSGRLKIGPDLKLYYTIGDQGANQFANACNEIRAQYLPSTQGDYSDYKGKVLRLNLNGTIPLDNPTLGGVQTHIYTYGHRNAQGLVFGSDGTLYSSEHGPKVDDEINIISAGKNYGWPLIAGYYDNLSYKYCNWSSATNCNSGNFSDHNCADGVTPIEEFISGEPLDHQEPIGTYNSTVGFDPGGGWLTWPTVGPSSIDIYEGTEIPGWDKSLLITTLKRGTIFRAKLSATGDALEDGIYEEFHSSNDRYRDIAIDPNNQVIYAITDNTGGTSGPSGTTSVGIENPGVIVKIQYGCIIGSVCDDGDACTTNDVYLDCDTCAGTFQDADGDGICDADDQCPGFDDNLIGTTCDDGDACTINDVYTDCDTCSGTFLDADGDGVCANDDPDDNDGCTPDPQSPACSTCSDLTTSFSTNPLTHSGGGSSSTTLNFNSVSQDVLFTISDLDQRTGGKPNNRYIDQVLVEYNNGSGFQDYGTFSGNSVSNVLVDIQGIVTAVRVTLSDGYDGSTSATMSVSFTNVDYCYEAASGKVASGKSKVEDSANINTVSNFKIFPNPAKSEVFVTSPESGLKATISLYTITGQVVKKIKITRNIQKVGLEGLSKGLYLLRVINDTGEELEMKRIIIE